MRAPLLLVLTPMVAQLFATPARAEGASRPKRALTLAWSAPPGCPPRAAVEQRIERLLAGSRRDDPIDAEVQVSRARDGTFTAHLHTRIRGTEGERTLTAATCDLAASASALVVALALDPDLEPEPVDAPPPLPPPPPKAAPPPPPEPPPVTESAPPLRLAVAAWLTGDDGSLPALAPGAGASVGLARDAIAVEGYGEAWTKQSAASPFRAGAGGDFDLVAVGARACARTAGVLRYGGCVGAEIERLHGVGFGVSNPGVATRYWIAPRAGGVLALHLSHTVDVPLHVDVLTPLPRPSFAIENVGAVFRPSIIAVRGSIGVEVHF